MDGETEKDRESEDTVTADVINFLIFLVKINTRTCPPHSEPHCAVTKYTHDSGIKSTLLCKIIKGQNNTKKRCQTKNWLQLHEGV